MLRRRLHAGPQEVEHLGRRGAEADQVLDRERPGGELADRDHRPDERERLDDRVDPRPVRQAGVHPRAHRVDPAAHRGDDPVDDPEHVLVAQERALDPLDLAVPLDVDVVGAVDHDLGDGLVPEERLQRPEAGEVVGQLLDEVPAFVTREHEPVRVDRPVDDRLDLGAQVDPLAGLAQRVVGPDEVIVQAGPDFAEGVPPRGRRSGAGRCRPDGHEGAGGGNLDPALRPLDPLEQRHSVNLPSACAVASGTADTRRQQCGCNTKPVPTDRWARTIGGARGQLAVPGVTDVRGDRVPCHPAAAPPPVHAHARRGQIPARPSVRDAGGPVRSQGGSRCRRLRAARLRCGPSPGALRHGDPGSALPGCGRRSRDARGGVVVRHRALRPCCGGGRPGGLEPGRRPPTALGDRHRRVARGASPHAGGAGRPLSRARGAGRLGRGASCRGRRAAGQAGRGAEPLRLHRVCHACAGAGRRAGRPRRRLAARRRLGPAQRGAGRSR